jgi:hypothetical protein
MNGKLMQIAERRRQLVMRVAAQRGALTRELQPWHARCALLDQGLAVLRYVRRHPAWLAGAVLLFAAWRPRGAGLWLQRGWVAWQLGRSLRIGSR